MRISLEWLQRYLSDPVTVDDLCDRVTMAGFPVDDREQLPNGDWTLDVEVTWNRPDCQSHLGIAREVAGLLGTTFVEPGVSLPELVDDALDVVVEADDLCPLYTARVVRGLTVGPSPDWLIRVLEGAGQRSVNNVVDITNFVLLECGHPLHAFDLGKLRGTRITARRGAGEHLTAIDGSKLEIANDEVVIADAEGPVALGGVMGGLDSEVGSDTTDIVLECALFDPLAIRATSRRHQLRSESSFRFERFVDPARAAWAADRAAALLVELGGATSVGPICAAGPGVAVHGARIELRTARVERVLGIPVPAAEICEVLSGLGLTTDQDSTPDVGVWRAPSWRPDLKTEVDLIEEVARRIGFGRIPVDVRIPVRPLQADPSRRVALRVRDRLAASGLRECCTAPFVGAGHLDIALFSDAPALQVENPMRADENLLRRSLIGPLLRVVRGNQDRGVATVRFFECASVYLRGARDDASDGATDQVPLASGVVTGSYPDAKGPVERVLDDLGVTDLVRIERGGPAPLRADRSATLWIGERRVGTIGELAPRTREALGIEADTAVFELFLNEFASSARLERPYVPVSRYPAVDRDLAVVLDESVTWARVASTVRSATGELLTAIEPLNVFRGPQIGAGRKSLALRMQLRASDRTLRGDEAEACVARVVTALESDLGGVLRA